MRLEEITKTYIELSKEEVETVIKASKILEEIGDSLEHAEYMQIEGSTELKEYYQEDMYQISELLHDFGYKDFFYIDTN